MPIEPPLPDQTVMTEVSDPPLWTILPPPVRPTAEAGRMTTLLGDLPLDGDLEPLRVLALDGAANRDDVAKAALALGRRSLQEDSSVTNDDAYSWLWRAGQCGSIAGALMVACGLSLRARILERMTSRKQPAAKKRVAAMRHLAAEWVEGPPSIWLTEPELQHLPTLVAEELREPSLHAGPTRVVIERWTGEDIDSDLESYRALAKPLPLVGGEKDPFQLVATLRGEFPWMEPAVDRVADDLALCSLAEDPWIHIRPLLLVGPPGSGKSRFARRLAELIGTGYQLIGAGESSDNRDLAGTAHGWSNREPGGILRLIRDCGHANPIIVVDEIDKAGGSARNGDIRHSLLALLEPETARRRFDECLQAHCDLSAVSWILTANDLMPISRPLLSRVSVCGVGLPGPEAIDGILDTMQVDIARELGLELDRLPIIEPQARQALANAFGRGRSLRAIKAALVSAMAASARRNGLKS